jgi:predicted solute-binding protein
MTISQSLRAVNLQDLDAVIYRSLRHLDWIEYAEASATVTARKLRESSCALALIPLGELLEYGGYDILPYGIVPTGSGPNLVILSNQPWEELTEIYFDVSGVVLVLRIILAEFYHGRHIAFRRRSANAVLGKHCGIALFGDEALRLAQGYACQTHIADLWRAHTGLPLPLAVWAARPGRLHAANVDALAMCFERACSLLPVYARDAAEERRLDRESTAKYVSEGVRYHLEEGALRAVETLGHIGREHRLLPSLRTALTGVSDINALLEDASNGSRISLQDTLLVVQQAELWDVLLAADVKTSSAGSKLVHAVLPLVNSAEAVRKVLTFEEIHSRLAALPHVTRLTLLAAPNAPVTLQYVLELIRSMRSAYAFEISALSPDTVYRLAELEGVSVSAVLKQLCESGLSLLGEEPPELLLDRERSGQQLLSCDDWLHLRTTAAEIGLRSLCSIEVHSGQQWEERLLHLSVVRQLHDETHCCSSFVCRASSRESSSLSVQEFLRVVAISRLFLDADICVEADPFTFGTPVAEICCAAAGATSALLRA